MKTVKHVLIGAFVVSYLAMGFFYLKLTAYNLGVNYVANQVSQQRENGTLFLQEDLKALIDNGRLLLPQVEAPEEEK